MILSLLSASAALPGALAGADDGPGDPEFTPNDGDLESEVRPLETPQVRSPP